MPRFNFIPQNPFNHNAGRTPPRYIPNKIAFGTPPEKVYIPKKPVKNPDNWLDTTSSSSSSPSPPPVEPFTPESYASFIPYQNPPKRIITRPPI